MKNIIFIIMVLLGANAPSNTIFAQKNRISIQTGLFHHFFDDTPLFNKERVTTYSHWRFPSSYFGGYLNESLGIQYQRQLKLSSLSIEYMNYNATYQPVFTNWTQGPRLHSRRLLKLNVSYLREIQLCEKWQFNYGGGINYQWGSDWWFLWTGQHSAGFWEPHFQTMFRKDLGLNTRIGLDYLPIKNLTLFCYIDFHGTLIIEYESYGAEDSYPTFWKEHGHEVQPSRMDLSLNFGIGYNFDLRRGFKK